ncbi:hypothetical protein JYT44_00315 [Caldithrix abyssi]|nr:hypothetical protein [Caldithrix abyssi]
MDRISGRQLPVSLRRQGNGDKQGPVVKNRNKSVWLSIGAIFAAVLGIGPLLLCCLPIIALAGLGAGSAALGMKLQPLQPYFYGLMIIFLGFAFYAAYKPQKVVDCAPGESCEVSRNLRLQRIILWTFTLVALAIAAFPYWSAYRPI